jgi:transposase IS116/IS110/IS902 family protein
MDGLALPQPYAGKVTSLRQLTGELNTEITMLSEVIADLLAAHAGYRVIQQLPGVGPVLAAVIIAEIGDVTRFRTAAQLSSWAGLTPKHRGSDASITRGRVTKQGFEAAAVGADRGHPARPGRVPCPGRQGRDHRQARPRGPERREGRRRPPAADPGLLRAARRPDPLPARTSRGRVSAPRPAGREAAPKSVPRQPAARTPI